MYNFSRAVAAKSLLDHIARAGVTFTYSDKGPVGLLTGKKVYVFAARGGCMSVRPLTRRPAMCATSCASSAWPTWNSSTPKASHQSAEQGRGPRQAVAEIARLAA